MVYTFEDKATIPDQIWPYSSDIASQRIPLIIDNGLSKAFFLSIKIGYALFMVITYKTQQYVFHSQCLCSRIGIE